jgi:hypothetical protein
MTKLNSTLIIICSTLIFTSSAEGKEDNPKIDVVPVILDSDSNDKKVLALEYKIEGVWKDIRFGKDDGIDTDTPLGPV